MTYLIIIVIKMMIMTMTITIIMIVIISLFFFANWLYVGAYWAPEIDLLPVCVSGFTGLPSLSSADLELLWQVSSIKWW